MSTPTTFHYDAEYTDTFGGEANYAWVRRAMIPADDSTTLRAVMRRAKAALGLSGVRGTTCDVGGTLEFRPYGSCTVLFVTYHDCPGCDDCAPGDQ